MPRLSPCARAQPRLALRASALLAACLTLLAGCGDRGAAAQGQNGRNAAVPVVVDTVREQPWTDSLRALGTVQAHEAVTVTAKVSETVQQVHFDSGQEVRRGAPLVTLSGQQQFAALAAAEAAATEAEALYRRQSLLAAQQLVSRAALDSQRAIRDAARAQVRQIRANLADRVIRAPFAGTLGIRQVSPGALVTPGTVIATLDDISRVYVDFQVPETELRGLAPGQAIAGRTGAWGAREFTGTVETVSARLDPVSRAATVRGEFRNPDRALKPGMLMEVSLARGTRPALVVPEIAVQQIGTETFVWRVKADGTVERADVEVGGRAPGKVMLAGGVKAGERIVVEGVGKLRDGAKIAPSEPAPTASPAANAVPRGQRPARGEDQAR